MPGRSAQLVIGGGLGVASFRGKSFRLRRIRSRSGELLGSHCRLGLIALMVLNAQGDLECQGKDEGKDATTIYGFAIG
jgi:hypothetical protein